MRTGTTMIWIPSRHVIFAQISILLLFCTVAGYCSSQDQVFDFLMVGDLRGWPNHLGDDEPAIDVTLVPARAFGQQVSDEYLYRQSRMYFPRTQRDLMDYDVLFFNHPRLDFFTPRQQQMMVDFAKTKGKVSIAYPLSNYPDVQIPWVNSPLCDVFPVDMEKFISASPGRVNMWWENRPLMLAKGLPPVFSVFEPTGIFEAPIYRTCRPCYAKQGATIWIYMIHGPPIEPKAPAFISWHYGDSQTWAFGIHPGEDRPLWQHAGDWWELIFLNVCMYTSGKKTLTFDEALSMRSVKRLLERFYYTTSIFQGMVEFVTKVGANTNEAESLMEKCYQIKKEAEEDYLQRRYDVAREEME